MRVSCTRVQDARTIFSKIQRTLPLAHLATAATCDKYSHAKKFPNAFLIREHETHRSPTNLFSRSQHKFMSQAHPIASSSSCNFQSLFNAALEAYEKKTKCKLLSHPLAAQLQSCNSPIAVLSVLQDLIQQFDRRRSSDERLTSWLNPTVNVLYAFSDFIGQGVGLVSLHSAIFLESLIRSSFFRFFHLQMWCFPVSASFFRCVSSSISQNVS
jgi:hypothetical protein